MSRILITGIAGFVGQWLARELIATGHTVLGSYQLPHEKEIACTISRKIRSYQLEITDPRACLSLLQKLRPTAVCHLAAISSVGQSFGAEELSLQVNLIGTQHLLAASRQIKLQKFLFVSSADIYGRFSPTNKLLTESQPASPVSPYAISKAAAEWLCQYAHKTHGVPAVIVRAFNHTGPGQTDRFAIPSFARQIALIEAGEQKPVISVGDLSAQRDFSDVRDVVRGYRLLLEHGKAGEIYQICSGKSRTVRSVLEELISLSTVPIRISVDKSRLRKADIPILRGSSAKIRKLGYRPSIRFAATLNDTLAYWRDQV